MNPSLNSKERPLWLYALVLAAALISVGCSDSVPSTGNQLSALGAYQPESTTSNTLPVNGATQGVGAIDTPIVSIPTPEDGRRDHTNAPLLDNMHPGWQQGTCLGCHTDQSRIPDHNYPDTSLCYLCHGTNGLPGFGDNIPPIISGVVSAPSATWVTISWSTNEGCISRLILRTYDGDRMDFPVNSEYVQSHRYTVKGLQPDKKFTFEIIVTDKNNNVTTSSSFGTLSFQTLATASAGIGGLTGAP